MHYCYAPLLHNPQPRPGSYVQSPAWQIGTSYTPPSGLPRRRRGSRAGRSNVSGKGQSREATPSMPFTTTISYVGPRCYRPGRGRGGNSLPGEENHAGPSTGFPHPRAGHVVVRDREGRGREAGPYTALLSPHPARASRSSPAHWRGQCR